MAGWILLLAFLFAATHEAGITKADGFSPVIFLTALSLGWAKTILIITCVGQFFCGMSCVTAGSRMLFAIPIYLRWKAGDSFVQGEWNLGKKWKWMAVQYAPIAMIIIVGGAMLWWVLGARKWFTGPVRTVDIK